MGLKDIAAADARTILNDKVTGVAVSIIITDPDGVVGNLTGNSSDIAEVIDVDTGRMISGREASVTLVIADLTEKGLGIPENVQDDSKKPWLVDFDDVNGNSYTFKVIRSSPDRTIGNITVHLGAYDNGS